MAIIPLICRKQMSSSRWSDSIVVFVSPIPMWLNTYDVWIVYCLFLYTDIWNDAFLSTGSSSLCSCAMRITSKVEILLCFTLPLLASLSPYTFSIASIPIPIFSFICFCCCCCCCCCSSWCSLRSGSYIIHQIFINVVLPCFVCLFVFVFQISSHGGSRRQVCVMLVPEFEKHTSWKQTRTYAYWRQASQQRIFHSESWGEMAHTISIVCNFAYNIYLWSTFQEAQRLGRILRAKKGNGFSVFFFQSQVSIQGWRSV